MSSLRTVELLHRPQANLFMSLSLLTWKSEHVCTLLIVHIFLCCLIYVNLGLVGPRGTLFVSFIHLINKNAPLLPEQQLTDDSQKWFRLLKPSSVYGLQAQCSIKVFILFHMEGTEFSFYTL